MIHDCSLETSHQNILGFHNTPFPPLLWSTKVHSLYCYGSYSSSLQQQSNKELSVCQRLDWLPTHLHWIKKVKLGWSSEICAYCMVPMQSRERTCVTIFFVPMRKQMKLFKKTMWHLKLQRQVVWLLSSRTLKDMPCSVLGIFCMPSAFLELIL